MEQHLKLPIPFSKEHVATAMPNRTSGHAFLKIANKTLKTNMLGSLDNYACQQMLVASTKSKLQHLEKTSL